MCALHVLFDRAVSDCFQLKYRKKKSSEPVWMTDEIRDLIRKQRRLFKRLKGKGRWLILKKITKEKIKKPKSGHVGLDRERFLDGRTKDFYKSVSSIMNGNEKEVWDIRTLFPGRTDDAVANLPADFFNGISQEYQPLNANDIPGTLTDQVALRLRKNKRSTSTVEGDLPPALYDHYFLALAPVITRIFNRIIKDKVWPSLWTREYVTVIPKGRSPEKIDQCRNISKILETFMLEKARGEISLKTNQYGREPECVPTHFLIDMFDHVASSLEDNRAAVVMTAIDLSKAFNRLTHQTCFRELAKKGASTAILQVVAAFLTGQTMAVKVGMAKSSPRTVNAGAPQGSVLGCSVLA